MTFETLGYNSTDALGFHLSFKERAHFPSMLSPYKRDPYHGKLRSGESSKEKEKKREISVLSQRKAWKPHNHIGMRHHKHAEVYRDASEQ